MALPKKKSRKIVVAGQTFRWACAGGDRVSAWRIPTPDEVDSGWFETASRFGLGTVCDFSLKIIVELWEKPVSRLHRIFYGILIGGFCGSKHNLQLLPGQTSSLIQAGLEDGWNPDQCGDFTLYAKGKSPLLLPSSEMPCSTEVPRLIWSKSANE